MVAKCKNCDIQYQMVGFSIKELLSFDLFSRDFEYFWFLEKWIFVISFAPAHNFNLFNKNCDLILWNSAKSTFNLFWLFFVFASISLVALLICSGYAIRKKSKDQIWNWSVYCFSMSEIWPPITVTPARMSMVKLIQSNSLWWA